MTARSVKSRDQNRSSTALFREPTRRTGTEWARCRSFSPKLLGFTRVTAMVHCHSRTRTGQVIRIERARCAYHGQVRRKTTHILTLPTRKAVPGRRRLEHLKCSWLTSAASTLKSRAQIVLEKEKRRSGVGACHRERGGVDVYSNTGEHTEESEPQPGSTTARAPPTRTARNSTSASSPHASSYWKTCVKMNQNSAVSIWLCGVRKSRHSP